MSNLGAGVIIDILGGYGEDDKALAQAKGKEVLGLFQEGDTPHLDYGGFSLRLSWEDS